MNSGVVMKNKRHDSIIRIISENVVETQEDLQRLLTAEGYSVTQSTVSRDIKQLRIVKGHDIDGNYRYISKTVSQSGGHNNIQKYIEMFVNSVKSVDYAMNDVVINCYPGMASSACVTVDTVFGDMIVGSLAGDDTVFIITRNETTARELVDKLNELL